MQFKQLSVDDNLVSIINRYMIQSADSMLSTKCSKEFIDNQRQVLDNLPISKSVYNYCNSVLDELEELDRK